MDIRYLMQILLLIIFFIGIYYVSCQCYKRQYGFLNIVLKEECSFIYSGFSKYIEKRKICAFDKYQIWRYIEWRRGASFIKNF